MVEALARWSPGWPPIAPDLFLPLAAESGHGVDAGADGRGCRDVAGALCCALS